MIARGIQPAKITSEAGHVWWKCPNCTRRLAEIVGGRVVIEARDRQISIGIDKEPEQSCPKCGQVSIVLDSANLVA